MSVKVTKSKTILAKLSTDAVIKLAKGSNGKDKQKAQNELRKRVKKCGLKLTEEGII